MGKQRDTLANVLIRDVPEGQSKVRTVVVVNVKICARGKVNVARGREFGKFFLVDVFRIT